MVVGFPECANLLHVRGEEYVGLWRLGGCEYR